MQNITERQPAKSLNVEEKSVAENLAFIRVWYPPKKKRFLFRMIKNPPIRIMKGFPDSASEVLKKSEVFAVR